VVSLLDQLAPGHRAAEGFEKDVVAVDEEHGSILSRRP
jgi:hypothetical protein